MSQILDVNKFQEAKKTGFETLTSLSRNPFLDKESDQMESLYISQQRKNKIQ